MTMMRMLLAVAMLCASILSWTSASAQNPDSLLDYYKTRPATLLDLYVESTKRTLDKWNLLTGDAFYGTIKVLDAQGEAYRSTLTQETLDFHFLHGDFSALSIDNRFAARFVAYVSPYHSILKEQLENEAAYKKLFSKLVTEAGDRTIGSLFEATGCLCSVETRRQHQLMREAASKTRLCVEWEITAAKDVRADNASLAARALAAKGVAARVYFARHQQVPFVGEQLEEPIIEVHDFRSIDDCHAWRAKVTRELTNPDAQDSAK